MRGLRKDQKKKKKKRGKKRVGKKGRNKSRRGKKDGNVKETGEERKRELRKNCERWERKILHTCKGRDNWQRKKKEEITAKKTELRKEWVWKR